MDVQQVHPKVLDDGRRPTHKRNVVFWVSEISGAMGDLGTLLPILVSLSKTGQVSLTSSLVFGGLFNILTGIIYKIPICVQPMKAIAAAALSSNLPQAQIVSAGMSVSAIILFLGATRLVHIVNTYIPLAIVRGIQLGAGISLITKGIASITTSNAFTFTNMKWTDNYLIAIISFLIAMVFYRTRFTPTAVMLFTIGVMIAVVRLNAVNGPMPFISGIHPTSFPPPPPSPMEFLSGMLSAGLGQLPLTLLNSVIAVSKLADDLFPDMSKPVASVTSISICVGVMNLVSGWFGSIPFCHGSGGLAAQYRFGARTGISIITLGATKIIIGFTFGQSLIPLFHYIPNSILGVLLAIAGLELAICAKDLGTNTSIDTYDDDVAVMIATAGSMVGFANDGIGFLIGCLAFVLLKVSRRISSSSWTLTRETMY